MSNKFEGKERIESLQRFEKFLKEGRKDFSNCVFLFPFQNNLSLQRTLTVHQNYFDGAVFAEKVEFHTMDFGNGFLRSSHIKNCTFDDTLSITNCTFHDIEFINCPAKEFILVGNKFLGKLKVSQSESEQYGARRQNLEVKKVKMEEFLFMHNTIGKSVLVRLGYLDVNYFHLRNMHNPADSEINIGECNFNTFIISNVRNIGKFRLYNINQKEEKRDLLILSDLSLGDSEFQNVDLGFYKEAFIKDNLFSSLKYTGLNWPLDFETDKTDTDHKKKRDAYRVLKNVAMDNNDAPQALRFYAKEMETYSKTLSTKKENALDRLILGFNRWTNDYGLSWFRPIFLILLFGALFYYLLLWSLDLSFTDTGNWNEFPIFLNPTHKTEFIDRANWNFLANSIDLLFRLIETTLIYQTIVAFRKFTRKL